MRKSVTLAALTLSAFSALSATAAAQRPVESAPPPQQQPHQTVQPTPQTQPTPLQPAPSTAGHEYAPLQEQELKYKDWTYNRFDTGEPVNLREWARGKRLVLVVYFAPWCGNWRMERPVLARLLDKYKPHGFDVLAVSNYATLDDLKSHFGAHPAPYAVVVESDSREARDRTPHYGYRQKTGDARKWGSPYNVFLAPAALARTGDVLAERVWVVNGELIEPEVERFIRERLGLPAEATEATKAEAKASKP
jgi:thiol-disulfide isomerase/thioredoxin